MFETSVVRAQAVAARGRYSLLTISLLAHSAVVAGIIAFSVATTKFPVAAPEVSTMFWSTEPPPPLGDPNGGAQKQQPTPPEQKPATPPPTPTQVTAPPTTMPDDLTPVDTPTTLGPSEGTGPSTGTTDLPFGVPWGKEGSIGRLDAPPSTTIAPPIEEKVYTAGGEVIAPQLIRRVEPGYPVVMQKARMAGTVVMRCVIDKNGHVRDANVVFATNAAFSDAVKRVLDQWRYKPASMRGQAVDCYLDLTVNFGINR